MSPNSFKRHAVNSIRKLSLTVAAGLFATLALAAPAAAQSCPNTRNYGERPPGIRQADETRRVRVQAVYFRTEDKNTLIPEVEGSRWNASLKTVGSDDFRVQLAQLVARGEAEVNSRRTGALYLGDTAALDRGPQTLNQNASYIDMAAPALDVKRARSLDRYTTFSVFRRPGESFYRVGLVSWFVDVRPDGGGGMTVDLDAGIFLRPGETQIVKFMGDRETELAGSGRTYLAITLVPVDDIQEDHAALVSSSDRRGR